MRRYAILYGLSLFFLPLNTFGFTLPDAEEALQAHQFDPVLEQLKPETLADPADQAYAYYLQATAAFGKEDYERALTLYDKVCTDFADSRWFVKATYRKAECLMSLKRYPLAEAIYAAGAQGLMTENRRNEIADIYIRHADDFFAPPKKNQDPSFERARTLYQYAKDILPKGPRWERVCYQIAMTHFKQEQWEEAQSNFQGLIAYYESGKPSTVAAEGEIVSASAPNPYPAGGYLDDALLQRGEAFYRLNNKVEARKLWKKMRDQRRDALKRSDIIAEAAYRIAKTYGIPQPSNEKELALGIRSIDEYVTLFPEHEHVPTAALDKALAYFHRNQHDKAIENFRTFLNRYEKKAKPEQNALAELHIARCLARQENYDEAIRSFKDFLIHHPADKNWSEAQQAIIDTRFQKISGLQRKADQELNRWTRKLHEEKKEAGKEIVPLEIVRLYDAIRTEIDLFQKDYPLDGRILSLHVTLGKNERALRKYEDAARTWRDIALRHPGSDPASEVLFLIAECTEQNLKDLEKAIDLYQEVTFGSYQSQAQERIRSLKDVYLAIRTERTFRTNEKPVIKVSSRNIENYTCKLYPLDLRAYFETRHTIRDIEHLDVNLIAAEKVWDVTPVDYAEYRLVEQELPVPVEKAGAWVVQLESKTLQAVTLVMVSDLAIAIKGGKKEVFVYAEDQREEKPVSKAEILIHDGKSIIAKGKTNGDGIFHVRDLNAVEAGNLSVFAIREGHCCGDEIRVDNLSVASVLQPRIMIYTDRPAYQPGNEVHYRALIREIEDGKYVIPDEYEFETTVLDARGTLIHQEKSNLSEYGTLHGRFVLDAASSLGQYRIAVSRKDGPANAWTFAVQEFTLPNARIEIETKQNTYFYGDKISGTITVSDFSGNPFAGEAICYLLATEWQDGTTDKDGKIAFEFDTWDLAEEGIVAIQAILPNRQIQGMKNITLVSTGFSISLETTRNTFLAGEPFQIRVSVRGRDDQQTLIAQPLKISLKRRNDEGGYEEVTSETVTTSEDEKKVKSITITAKTGGRYRIEAEGTDSRGTLVTSRKTITISGEDDSNKLLVLSDQSYYQQGETATFTVFSRLPENLVLMTGEREGVVEYRVESLKPGKNTVRWTLDDRYSPKCDVSFVVMNENRVYHAQTQFNVYRGLEVKVTPNAEKYGPRDEAELLVETRDHNGKAVAAELSLGLIDKALLALFPDPLGDLSMFFDQAARGRFLATASSADFSYEGVTRSISEEILRNLSVEGLEILDDAGLQAAGLRKGVEVRKAKEAAQELKLMPAAPPAAEPALELARAEGLAERGVRARRAAGRLAAGDVTELRMEQQLNGLATHASTISYIGDQKLDQSGRGYQANFYAAGTQERYFANQPVLGTLFSSSDISAGVMRAGAYAYGVPQGGSGGYAGYGMMKFGQGIEYGLIRTYFPDTAYFNPCVMTDDSGKAVVRIPLPDTLTTWEAQARAITKDTLVNQGKKDVVVDKPFRVDWEAPAYLTEGDRSGGVAAVRNSTEKKREGKLVFTQTIAGREQQSDWAISLKPSELHKQVVPLTAENVGDSTVTVSGAADELQDHMSKPLPVKPWGIPVRVGDSGIASQNVVKDLSLPSQADYSQVNMWVTFGGVGDFSMLAPAWSGVSEGYSTRAIVEQGLAALAALDCAEQLKKIDFAPIATLREQIESAVRHAIAAQTEEGLWAWGGGRDYRADMATTGRATELLRKAKARGFAVADTVFEKAAARLDALYQETTNDSLKIQILYARSFVSAPDFAYVNRVHRNPESMDARDAALLGLTWLNMSRTEKAQEILQHLISSNKMFTASSAPTHVDSYTVRTPHESLAMAARLYFLLPASVRSETNTRRFLENLSDDPVRILYIPRIPVGWRIQALAAYLQSAAEEQQSFELIVRVNEKEITRKRIVRSSLPRERIEIDPSLIHAANNRVEIVFNGKGSFHYSFVLEGWTKQDVRPQQWLKPEEIVFTQVDRFYEHGPLTYNHREIPRGYGVVAGSVEAVKNELQEVRMGDRVNVRLEVVGPQSQDYVIVQDRLPAGLVLVNHSVNGPVDHYEMQGNQLTFYLRSESRYNQIHYQLQSLFPGTYRIPPAIVTSTNKPEQIYATSSRNLIVLEEGQNPKIAYHPTPDELYYSGLWHFEDGKYEEANKNLTQLMNAYSLNPEPYLEAAKKLFQIHLQNRNSKELVRYFEIIKERDREFEITFDHIAILAKAYRDLGEQERAVYVYRALLDGLFKQEGAVSGTLQEVGRYREALDYAKQLILEYPDIPTVQTAVYTTGSVIYRNVNQWAQEPDFMKAGNDKKALLAEAVGMMQSFLTLYSNNPAADEAGYTLLNLWLDQKNYETVNRLAESLSARYPRSLFLDSYDFLRAYALFQLERYTPALDVAEKVATAEYPAAGGGVRRSDETNNAVHMAGKILHASGELDRALEQYERVKESFGDAVDSIKFLTERGLSIEEVAIFGNQEPAKIDIRHKNLEQAELSVYKVDLMSFYLTERDLSRMADINLAGITPIVQRTLEFANQSNHDWNETPVELPIKESGAYLIVLRGNGITASGMVLRSDLALEVQEDPGAGNVRVNIKKGKPALFAKDVKVQVRGSENERFVNGTTDLRGVFSASGIQGVVTVLAQLGDQYGFYRGTTYFGQPEEKADKKADGEERLGRSIQIVIERDDLAQNTARLNELQARQMEQWDEATDPTNNRLVGQKAYSLY